MGYYTKKNNEYVNIGYKRVKGLDIYHLEPFNGKITDLEYFEIIFWI